MNDRIEHVRYEARQMLAEGRDLGFPLALTYLAIQLMMRKEGLPVPRDILAFTFEGKISDAQVTNWQSPVGG
ncbi:hypothetical protein [Chenggangzhangella methanolivorans]|uniref:Uncharacterized protein n=1 Tax=Chenggangzhangella methanolivorans TaxID=1437009 RepID=A0A9E6R757_9HYPH|nr:hypothetical protein [Chenggangzhangella methanolivorans]QZN98631.1 hypothetical protein K6K41_16585 [Chenggangzhangella methanolivorans]